MKTSVLIATVFVAIICGLMYGYAFSVNPGLRKLRDVEYLLAMQSINRAILNPWFLVCFVGALPMQAISLLLVYRSGGTNDVFVLICLSTIVYFGGVVLVTGIGNVPLNESLDGVDVGALTEKALRLQREKFEIPWVRFHSLRTAASVVSLVLMLAALVRFRP